MKRIGILSSHNGSGFEYIQNACENKELNAKVVVVVSNNSDAKVLQKANSFGIDNHIINANRFPDEDLDEKITLLMNEYKCDYIFLSGYMKKIGLKLIHSFNNKIINTHPSLLPKFGGKGMYGRKVHEAVIASNESSSGVTIHYVNENYDEGEYILQKSIVLDEKESVDTLEDKIKNLEKEAIIEALKKLI